MENYESGQWKIKEWPSIETKNQGVLKTMRVALPSIGTGLVLTLTDKRGHVAGWCVMHALAAGRRITARTCNPTMSGRVRAQGRRLAVTRRSRVRFVVAGRKVPEKIE